MQSGENPLLKAAVTAIDEHDVLWQKYWKDFVANRFHLNAGEDKLTFEILNLTFARPLTWQDARKKLVALHSTAHTNQINLAKLVSSLRPLQKLQNVVETTLAPTMSPMSQNPSTMFMSVVDQSPGHVHDSVALYQFVIDTLFSALAEDCLKCGNENMNYCEPEKLEVWRECYRDVVCMHVCSVYCICIHTYVCVHVISSSHVHVGLWCAIVQCNELLLKHIRIVSKCYAS